MKHFRPIQLNCSKEIASFCEQEVKSFLNEKSLKDFEQISLKVEFPEVLLNLANEEFKSLGFPEILYSRIYVRGKRSKQGIHIDGAGEIIHAAVNIPIKGSGVHSYYTGDYELSQVTRNDLICYNIDWKSVPSVEERLILTSPYLVSVDKPHSVFSDGEERWAVTIRFRDNPKFEELKEKLNFYQPL